MLKELRDNLLQKTLKNGQKFYNCFILASVWSIQLIGVHLFLKIKKLWVNIVHENPKNEHFSTKKMPKNYQKWPWMAKMVILFINSTLAVLTSIQLIRMRLFYNIK